MTRRSVFRAAARREFDDAADWYERQVNGLGQSLIDEINVVLERIRETPGQFPIVFEPDVRQALVSRFPYSILFRASAQQIRVIAVFHGHRDPRIWQRRV